MKVKFNGLVEKRTNGGCNCKRQSTGYSFIRSKMFIMPSGAKKMFYEGSVEEVSERDGAFLLSMNGEREVFTEVGD